MTENMLTGTLTINSNKSKISEDLEKILEELLEEVILHITPFCSLLHLNFKVNFMFKLS